jgi:hypothetical protein
MTIFEIHAGDFGKGTGVLYANNHFSLPGGNDVPACLLTSVDVATEENVKKLGGAVGWGLAGGALLGPVGLLAGLLMGGKGKNIVFTVQFRDGRKMLVSGDSKAYTAIQSAAMDAPAAFKASLAKSLPQSKTNQIVIGHDPCGTFGPSPDAKPEPKKKRHIIRNFLLFAFGLVVLMFLLNAK